MTNSHELSDNPTLTTERKDALAAILDRARASRSTGPPADDDGPGRSTTEANIAELPEATSADQANATPSVTDVPKFISDQHMEILAASGITPEFAQRRGYETIRDDRKLALAGIARAGQRTQGILIPLLRANGTRWGYQYRPDSPREVGGKPRKYETPISQHNHLDVPPGVGPMLGDPKVTLWVTEGSKKADCAASHGLCCVALTGTWNWRGTNAQGGTTAIADFNDVAWNDGREVVIAYDGDTARNSNVRDAAAKLGAYLTSRGARVHYLHLPNTDQKTGLDDFLMTPGNTVADLEALVFDHLPGTTATATTNTATNLAGPTDADEPAAAIEVEDGAKLLDELVETLTKYVVFANRHQAVAVALWIAATHRDRRLAARDPPGHPEPAETVR